MEVGLKIETRRNGLKLEVLLERNSSGVGGAKLHRELVELEGEAADKFERAVERVAHSG